jgi:flagellar assembly protein FliH
LPESAPLPAQARADGLDPVAAPDVATLLAEADAMRQRGHEEGRQEGLRQGQRDGYAEGFRRGSDEARQVVEEARAEALELRRAAVDGIGRLACEIASHLIGTAMALDPDLVTEHVARILAESQPLGVLEVCVSPQDLHAAREAKLRWQSEMAGEADVAVVPDADLAPGACRVRTRGGDLEWLWPERLAEIDHAMEEVARRFGLDA